LYKYDGYTATKYINDPFDPNSLSQNIIYTCWIDNKDTIWLGTPEGLCKFDRLSEKFIRYDTIKFPGMPDLGNVGAISGDDQGNLWIGNYEGDLWRYNKKTGEFLSLPDVLTEENKTLDSLFHDAIFFIFKDREGTIWLGTNNGIKRLNIIPGKAGEQEKFSFTYYLHEPLDSNNLGGNEVSDMIQDHNGIYWITDSKGLISFDHKTEKFTRFKIETDDSHSVVVTEINSLLEDPDHNIWLGTNRGLYRLNEERTNFSAWYENPNDEFGLKSNYITSLGIDAGGNLFLSAGNSIQSHFLDQKAFNILKYGPENIYYNRSIAVSALAEGIDNIVWIGTPGAGLQKWERSTGKLFPYRNDSKNSGSLQNNNVGALLQDPAGDLWIGTTGYLSRLKNGSDIFEHFKSDSRNITNTDAINIYALCKDREGLIWLEQETGLKVSIPQQKNSITIIMIKPILMESVTIPLLLFLLIQRTISG
jgi:ligand-binding sensor domain-containing protein